MKRAILLDRDGTLIQRPGIILHPRMLRVLPGVREALKLATDKGVHLAILTNQPLAGSPVLSERSLQRVHDALVADLTAAGAEIEFVLHCPHWPREGCDCHKPEPGMVHEALQRLGPDEAWMIGDTWRDVGAAQRAGIPGALVTWQAFRPGPKRGQDEADLVTRSTPEAIRTILQGWDLL